MLTLLIAALLGTEVPAAAPCACTCGNVVATADSATEREWARAEIDTADAVFTGRVIAAWSDWTQRRNHYTFAVHQSWKGVEEDTAHVTEPLIMEGDAVYAQGRSYLVIAMRTPDGFQPPLGATSIPADSTHLAAYLPALGTPRHSFPGDTVSSIEALIPPSVPYVPGPTRVDVQVTRSNGEEDDEGSGSPTEGVRVSVVGTELGGTTDSSGLVSIAGLDSRWYRFRLEFPGGEVHEAYGAPRCADGSASCSYTMLTFFVGQEVPGH